MGVLTFDTFRGEVIEQDTINDISAGSCVSESIQGWRTILEGVMDGALRSVQGLCKPEYDPRTGHHIKLCRLVPRSSSNYL